MTRIPSSSSDRVETSTDSRYQVRVSVRFLTITLLSCTLVAFAIGRTARLALERDVTGLFQMASQKTTITNFPSTGPLPKLPPPVLKEGKHMPQTTYTSKNYDTSKSAITSRWVVKDDAKCFNDSDSDYLESAAESETDEDETHMPRGQHLLLDIEYVDETFLNSEERLAEAMLELVNECGLTMLSYHCHGLSPTGVTCAGVLLESHVSFHTWPSFGTIVLDLYTCGEESLLPIVSRAQKLFSVADGKSSRKPTAKWAYKLRGFDDETTVSDIAEMEDFFMFPIGQMTDYKEKIVSAETKFQRVDVYDVLQPAKQNLEDYAESLSGDGSYQASHPKFFEPDRIVFLDGVLQSRRSGDAAYHEALVHPSMFAHDGPKRVAIIGGGEGATLREVLKHKTVEKVVMIEIDKEMVRLSREYLPEWNDCSMLIGRADNCFDDERVEVYYDDAFAWFIDRFGTNSTYSDDEHFDVIIMDALDPQVQKDFVDALYDDGPFLQSLPRALNNNGVFLAQLGEAPYMWNTADEDSLSKNRAIFLRTLVKLGFQSIIDYEESHAGFFGPWQYAIAFKSFDSKANWYDEPSVVDLKIRERLLPTVDGESPVLYFDGPTMLSYRFPSKSSEVVFCRGSPNMPSCKKLHGFDPERENLPLSVLEVKESSLGEHAGRGVFAKQRIPQSSYIGLGELTRAIYVNPKSYDLIHRMEGNYEEDFRQGCGWWQNVLEIYMHGYGHSFSSRGGIEVYVDPTFQCFINHGCKGSNNVGHSLSVTEETSAPDTFPGELEDRYLSRSFIYNPAAERDVHFYSSAIPLRDIMKGEELLDNYLGMTGRKLAGWSEDVIGLKAQCEGALGTIKEAEMA